jgi:predicted RNA-binding protein YlxR (DUF448 family)
MLTNCRRGFRGAYVCASAEAVDQSVATVAAVKTNR